MTTETITDQAQPTPEPTTPTETETDAPEPEQSSNREAAKYRKQLREVEAERDAAQELINAARLELLAAKVRATELVTVNGNVTERHGYLRPEALEDAGIDPGTIFDGMAINEAKLQTALANVYETKPYLFAAPRLIIPNEGDAPSNQTANGGWEGAFAPTKH